jgi:hypothetical protein
VLDIISKRPQRGLSIFGSPCSRSSSDLKIGFTLSLVRSNDRRATEARNNGSGTVIAAAGAFLEFLGNVDGQDRGNKSGDKSELHGEDNIVSLVKREVRSFIECFGAELSEECT